MTDDLRLYLIEEDWQPLINLGDQRLFCHRVEDGQSHYHRIAAHEMYVAKDTENFCLACAIKKGILSTQRPTLEGAPPVAP